MSTPVIHPLGDNPASNYSAWYGSVNSALAMSFTTYSTKGLLPYHPLQGAPTEVPPAAPSMDSVPTAQNTASGSTDQQFQYTQQLAKFAAYNEAVAEMHNAVTISMGESLCLRLCVAPTNGTPMELSDILKAITTEYGTTSYTTLHDLHAALRAPFGGPATFHSDGAKLVALFKCFETFKHPICDSHQVFILLEHLADHPQLATVANAYMFTQDMASIKLEPMLKFISANLTWSAAAPTLGYVNHAQVAPPAKPKAFCYVHGNKGHTGMQCLHMKNPKLQYTDAHRACTNATDAKALPKVA